MNDDQIVDRKHYLNAVLMLYLELPETPLTRIIREGIKQRAPIGV